MPETCVSRPWVAHCQWRVMEVVLGIGGISVSFFKMVYAENKRLKIIVLTKTQYMKIRQNIAKTHIDKILLDYR